MRRLHDVNRSGWWLLIALTLIGIIPLLYWGGFKKGEPHGEIIQTFADGAKFEGNIDSETGVSKGVYIYADGKIEKGTWENDKLIKSE